VQDPKSRVWTRRAALTLASGTALAVAGAATAYALAQSRYAPPPPLPGGRLRVAEDALGQARVGSHRLRLSEEAFLLEDGQGRVLWSTAGAAAFLIAGRGGLDWTETTGHFSFERTLEQTFDEQSVEAIQTGDDWAELRGHLSSADTTDLPYTLRLRSTDPHRLEAEFDVPGADLVLLRFDRETHEGVHGLGAQFTDFDLTGRYVPVLAREQGVGRGRQPLTTLAELVENGGGSAETTYAATPFAMTDTMRALDVQTHHLTAFDLREDERFDVEIWQEQGRAVLYSGAGPSALLQAHTADTGRQEPLPDWSGEGAVIGVQGGTDAVRTALDGLEEAGAAVTGVWIQDWCGQRRTDFGERLWWHWELDTDRYPGWDDLVTELNDRGIRVLTYVNPFLTSPGDKPGGVGRDLFAEASEAGYFVRSPDGGPYMLDQGGYEAALVDLTCPDAWTWFRDVIAEQVAGVGADGWMADFAEGLPMDAVLHEGSAREWHNRWPVEWARLNREAAEHADRPDALVFHRSAGRGSAAHTGLFWAGDQNTSFDHHDGLGSALRGLLSAGVSGMALNHSDTGGYTGLDQPLVGLSRDRELLLRWAETNVWGPVLRTHEGNLPASNAQAYDAECRRAFAEQTRLFAALAPYRAEVVAEAARTGMPVLRHAWVQAPESPAARVDDAFLFGPTFFVAPTLAPGESETTALLPPGQWVHLWTGERFDGDTDATVQTPLGRPAVFHRFDDDAGRDLREQLPQILD